VDVRHRAFEESSLTIGSVLSMAKASPAETKDKASLPETKGTDDKDAGVRVLGEAALPDWHARALGRSLGPATDKAVRQGRDLIDAAARLMRRLQPDELTMQNIAAEAGVSVRVLYRHFEGKDDLLVALIEESQIVFARMIEKATAGIPDPLDRLGEALYFATTDARQQAEQNFSRSLARFTVQTSLTSPDLLGAAHRPVISVLADMVEGAMRTGQIEAGDPDTAASTLYCLYEAHQRNAYLGNSLGGPLPSTDELIRFCLLGLGAHLPPGWEQRLGQHGHNQARGT
jgi:AcrR family transcriptional regulator